MQKQRRPICTPFCDQVPPGYAKTDDGWECARGFYGQVVAHLITHVTCGAAAGERVTSNSIRRKRAQCSRGRYASVGDTTLGPQGGRQVQGRPGLPLGDRALGLWEGGALPRPRAGRLQVRGLGLRPRLAGGDVQDAVRRALPGRDGRRDVPRLEHQPGRRPRGLPATVLLRGYII